MDNQELDLIKRAQQGDTQSFEKLVCLHDRRVLQLAYSMMGNRQDAQDIYQEAFMRAFVKIASFRFESEFGTWLGRIVINLSINRRRQRRMRRLFFGAGNSPTKPAQLDEFENPHPSANLTDGLVMAKETRYQLEQALNSLPELQRAVFTLKHMHGYKISEISRMLDKAEGTVKNSLFRAVQKLRVQLQPYFEKD